MAEGILVVDKPPEWTSHDVVAKLRGVLAERRIGHGGTLDPMATGVLPVFVGRATRAVEFAAAQGKEYLAVLRLGLVTDTQDTTGTVLETHPVPVLTRAQVEGALAAFTGDLLQIPPMYSAVKVGGKKLYELARKGQEIERKPRPVTVSALELVEELGQGEYRLRVVCSKGTYIRTLCHDLGRALGCGGAMAGLRRTRAAGFSLAQAVTLEQILAHPVPQRLLLPVDTLFRDHAALTVDAKTEGRIRNGAAVSCGADDGVYRVYGPQGAFLMLGRAQGQTISCIKNFFEVN